MKFRRIVGFGDSWMYGDELLDPELAASDPEAHSCWSQNVDYREQNCFLGRLAKHYGVAYENFGIPGGSIRSTIWTYLWWIQKQTVPNDSLVLVCITESDRESFYNPDHVHYSNDPEWNKFVHSTWVEFGSSVISQQWRDMAKRHLVLTNSAGLRALNYLECLMFFDGQAARHNLPLLQFNTMPAEVDLVVPSLIWPDFCWSHFFRDHADNQKRELIMPNGHPNEKGHAMMAQMLIPEIDCVILSK